MLIGIIGSAPVGDSQITDLRIVELIESCRPPLHPFDGFETCDLKGDIAISCLTCATRGGNTSPIQQTVHGDIACTATFKEIQTSGIVQAKACAMNSIDLCNDS